MHQRLTAAPAGRFGIAVLVLLAAASCEAQTEGRSLRITPNQRRPEPSVRTFHPAMLGIIPLPRTCELQVEDPYGLDGLHYRAIADLTWDWNHTPTTIRFRWRDTNPRTTRAVWQVSLLKCGDSLKDWKTPPGIVAKGDMTCENPWYSFSIDFGAFAPTPRSGRTSAPAIRPRKTGGARSILTPVQTTKEAAAALRVMALTGPISFWVRVVPLDASGKPTGFASKPTQIRWGPLKPGSSSISPVMLPPTADHPKVRVVEYVPIRWPGNPYLMLCVQDWPPNGSAVGPSFKKGHTYDFTPRPKSGFEEFVDSLGGLASFLADAVDWASKAFDTIKNALIDIVCDCLGEWARGPAMAALELGMAALGIPPSLPNFDELCSMGADYLETVVAEQVPGLPPDAAKAAIDGFVSAAKRASEGGDGAAIFVQAPSERRSPAVLWLEASNPSSQPTTPLDAQIIFGKYTPDWKQVADMTNKAYLDGFPPRQVFLNRDQVHLPSLRPGQKLRVPVVLEPSYDYDRDPDNVQWACWALGYHQPQELWVNTTLRNPNPNGPASTGQQQHLTFTPSKHYP